MKVGKIISTVGDEIIASVQLTQKPLDLETARKLVGQSVFLQDTPNAKLIGKVTNVIARTDEPFFVVSRHKKKMPAEREEDLRDKFIYAPVKLKI